MPRTRTWTTSPACVLAASICVLQSACAPVANAGRGLLESRDLVGDIRSASAALPVPVGSARFQSAVNLLDSERYVLDLRKPLDTWGGTLSFWVKPNWAAGSHRSHALVSGLWSGTQRSYLAISEGWWEPTGTARLYFIASNEDLVHCSSDIRLATDEWSLVTVTWRSSESKQQGHCKLYVDDELRASVAGFERHSKSTLERLNVGNDLAASNAAGRKADAQISGLKVLGYPVSHRQVIERYQAEEAASARDRKKWSWAEKVAADGTKETADRFRRAIFDEDLSWAASRESIDARLLKISRAGFDIYIPCVWHGSGTVFPTDKAHIEPRFTRSLKRGWDPLAYLLTRAHEKGIEVHPWFTVARREDDRNPAWAGPGVPAGAYDFHDAEFRRFISDLMMEVVNRYPVDGLNLDYIRTMGVCTSRACQGDYRQRTGFDLLQDYADDAPTPEARSRISRWQDEAVSQVVSEVAARARSAKPSIFISVDGNVTAAESLRPLEGRNEIAWANRGWIDAIFHMDYRPTPNIQTFEAGRARLTDPGKLWLAIGNYDFIDGATVARGGPWLGKFVGTARSLGLGRGIGVYLLNELSPPQVEALR